MGCNTKHVHFIFNEGNPDERLALEILEQSRARGLRTRDVIREALLLLDERELLENYSLNVQKQMGDIRKVLSIVTNIQKIIAEGNIAINQQGQSADGVYSEYYHLIKDAVREYNNLDNFEIVE